MMLRGMEKASLVIAFLAIIGVVGFLSTSVEDNNQSTAITGSIVPLLPLPPQTAASFTPPLNNLEDLTTSLVEVESNSE